MKRTMQKVGGMVVTAALAFLAAVMPATANNMAVTNVVLVNQDTSAKTVDVQFDLSWQNSWRTVLNTDYPAYTNWDAAWVFVKFQQVGLPTNNWQHALLSTSGHTPAANSTIAVGTNDASGVGVGAFVYRNANYTGDVSYTGMRLRWNYGANGQTFAKGASVVVSVQAIEMVYVPQGQFYLGSTGTEESHFYDPTVAGQTTNAFLVSSENAITVGTDAGSLYYTNSTYGGDQLGPIPDVFPKGYNAFYCMKYDISQGQYRDFLNMLTRDQQNTRTTSQVASNYAMSGQSTPQKRESIRCPATIPGTGTNIVFGCDWNNNMVFDEPGDGMDRACNALSWSAGAAYAAWAGLRPMTELEYEKACRGPALPFAGEYAWGDATLTKLTTETPDGYGTSTANSGANCLAGSPTWSGGGGPCRVGIFATTSSTRAQAGASYWGIMELSGNLWKRPMSVGSTEGRAFTGSNGSGVLNSSGQATNSDWNSIDAKGTGFRGGNYNNDAPLARVSDRIYAALTSTGAGYDFGWRAVRAAP